MNNIKLSSIIKRFNKTNSFNYIGILPKDHIPLSLSHYPYCFIANTDYSYSTGKHWVVFYYHSKYDLEFFDSLGKSPSHYHFYIDPNVQCTYLHAPLQSFNSKLCGLFCLYYLYCKTKHKSLLSISRFFSFSNLHCNDYHLYTLFKKNNLFI